MQPRTLRRLFPLIITMLLGILLTAAYVRTAPKENTQCTESKNGGSEKRARGEFMIWRSLSTHLLSLH